MKKISIILLFLAAVCPLAQAQRVKVYVTDAWDKPLGEVAVTLGRGRIPVAVTGADGMAEVDAGEGDADPSEPHEPHGSRQRWRDAYPPDGR